MTDVLPNPTAFTSGLPWADATGFGNGNDDAAISAAIAAVQALPLGRGTVYCPGLFTFNNTVHVPIGVRLVGAGMGSGTIFQAARDVTMVSLDGFESTMEEIGFAGFGFGATQPAIVVSASASEAMLRRVRGGFGYNALLDQGVDTVLDVCTFAWGYGDAVVKKSAGNGFYRRGKFDQDYPVLQPPETTQYADWAPNTLYQRGTIVKHPAGYIIQCADAGTSGAGAPALANFSTPIVDRGAQWLLMGSANYTSLYITGTASQMEVQHCDITFAGWAAIAIDASGHQQVVTDNTIALATLGIYVGAGAGHDFKGNTIQDGIRGANNFSYGILFQDTAGGSHGVVDNLIFDFDFGVYHNFSNAPGSGVGTDVAHNRIFNCRQAALYAAAGAGGFSWIGNKCGASNEYGQNARPAVVAAGPGADITIALNEGRGAGAGFSFGATGANNLVSSNNWSVETV